MKLNLEFQTLTATIGAESIGGDLKKILMTDSNYESTCLRDALVQHKVLVFRDQHPDSNTHIEIGKKLGRLAPKHPLYPKVRGHQDIIRIVNDDTNPPENEVWHADLSYNANPCFAAVLHGYKIPAVGGDTLFADMDAVVTDMSEPFKKFLRGLTAHHSLEHGFKFVHDRSKDDRSELLKQTSKENYSASHPLLRAHPITGKEILYVNASFTEHVNELSGPESKNLLDYLFALVQGPRYQLRVKWQKGTVLIWDNWATQHFACGDHYPNHREVRRVTVQSP